MIEIWPHEFYFVAGLLIMAGLGLFLFTSALGRVWCGYACPQTVWTDLFILVERWIEGDRNARIRLHRQGWDAEKIRKRAIKWTVWFLIGLATGGAWVFYFTDAPTLFHQLVTFQAPAIAYITMLVLTATTFAFGGFAREQICIYACPWPRIQAAMMDEDTITVAYRDWRGEPRASCTRRGAGRAGRLHRLHGLRETSADGHRHPQRPATGLHHLCAVHRRLQRRDGQDRQAARPDRLLGADRREGRTRGQAREIRLEPCLPPAHAALHGAVVGGGDRLVVALFLRSDIDMSVTPVRNPTFVTLSDGTIRNTYDLRLRNKLGEDRTFTITLTSGARMNIAAEGLPDTVVTVPANQTMTQRIYVTAPPDTEAATAARTDLRLWVVDTESNDRIWHDTIFNGAGK